MENYVKQFITYLKVERNYSQHTVDIYELDLSDFMKFLTDETVV